MTSVILIISSKLARWFCIVKHIVVCNYFLITLFAQSDDGFLCFGKTTFGCFFLFGFFTWSNSQRKTICKSFFVLSKAKFSAKSKNLVLLVFDIWLFCIKHPTIDIDKHIHKQPNQTTLHKQPKQTNN